MVYRFLSNVKGVIAIGRRTYSVRDNADAVTEVKIRTEAAANPTIWYIIAA